jgi:hypothetical protein
MTEVEQRLERVPRTVVSIARELLIRNREPTVRANELQREITMMVRRLAPSLLSLPGCGVLTTAKIVVAFVLAELRRSNPVLNVRYFKRATFATSSLIAFTAYFGTFAIFFMVALYLQVVVSVSPLGLALDFVPLAVGMVVASLFSGRWVAAWGPRIPMATGCLLAGVGILLTNAMIGPHVGIGEIGWTMFLAGVGVGMAMVPVTSAALGSIPPQHSGMAASTTNTFRELGAVVGVAVLGSIVNGQLTVNLVQRLTAIGIPKSYQSLVVTAVTTGTYQGQAKAVTAKNPAVTHIVNEVIAAAYGAFGHGLNISLNIAGGLLLGSAVLALATVYGRRVHAERVNSEEGHLLHLSVEGEPGVAVEGRSGVARPAGAS